MSKFLSFSSYFFFLVLSLPCAASPAQAENSTQNFWSADAVIESRDCILNIVVKKMGIKLKPSVPAPTIIPEGTISFLDYQKMAQAYWGWKPEGFINLFEKNRNEIYLHLKTHFYLQKGASPFDSLAHELTHFMQHQYQGWELDDLAEGEATKLQFWFRDEFKRNIVDQRFVCPVSQ